jgi:hypothetical protein
MGQEFVKYHADNALYLDGNVNGYENNMQAHGTFSQIQPSATKIHIQ